MKKSQVLVSTKFQVVIPKEIREENRIKSGQKLTCISKGGMIYLIPHRPIEEMRGFIKAKLDLKDLREKKDRFE